MGRLRGLAQRENAVRVPRGAVLCWHLMIKGEDYAFAQPSLVAHKQRKLELRAGPPSTRGHKGKSAGYSLAAVRAAERDLAVQAETAYRTMVAAWRPTRPPAKGSAKQGGRGPRQRDATIKH